MANSKTADPEMDLEQMTVAELKDLADSENITVPSHATKDEIIKAIEKGQKANAKAAAEVEPSAQGGEVTPLAQNPTQVPIPLADIVADAYGIGRKYNIALADIQSLGAFAGGTFVLDNLPAGAVVQYVRIKNTIALVSSGMASCPVQVGDSVPQNYGGTFDICTAVTNANLLTVQLTATNVGNFATTTQLLATLTGNAGTLGAATAGAFSIWVRYTIIA